MNPSEISALLRARNPLLWIVTREESRAEAMLAQGAAAAGYVPVVWDVAAGARTLGGEPDSSGLGADPAEILDGIERNARDGAERRLWILRDFPVWLDGLAGASVLRRLRNLTRSLPMAPRDRAQAVAIVTPRGEIPPELSAVTAVLTLALPTRAELGEILDSALAALPDDIRATAAPNGSRDAAIEAALGLTSDEAAACFARSLVQRRAVVPAIISAEKRRVIARERVLQWYDPMPGGLDSVGGLAALKDWLRARALAYTPAARQYGLPMPKGCVLIGVPGCGKSLTAKAIAAAWQIPLLRLDMGQLKSKYVGESEGNLRRALQTVDAVGRCVVWIDEIEKALAGAVQGAADGGVSADALGTILTWQQERDGGAFVIATANDVAAIPPEFLRKGRFDEIWFVDLPDAAERVEILRAALRAHNRNPDSVDCALVAERTVDYSGAELAALIPDALFAAFADGGRDVRTEDLLAAASAVVPMAKSAGDKIAALRRWAVGRARAASRTVTAAGPQARQIDV